MCIHFPPFDEFELDRLILDKQNECYTNSRPHKFDNSLTFEWRIIEFIEREFKQNGTELYTSVYVNEFINKLISLLYY